MAISISFKRILVAGAGAIGGYFGGMLAISGNDVTFLARGERLNTFRGKGLTVKDKTESTQRSVAIKAVDLNSLSGQRFDLIIIAVKSDATAVVTEELARTVSAKDTVFLSLQNGVENVGEIRRHFPDNMIVGAVVNSGISSPSYGVVEFVGVPKVTVGASGYDPITPDLEKALYALFANAGVSVGISENIEVGLWSKLVWNMAFNPLSAILGDTCGQLLNSERSRWIMTQIATETVAVAHSMGVFLPKDIVEKTLKLNPVYDNYKTSALQDAEKNRVPEIEGLMGAVVHSDIDTPVSRTIYQMALHKFGKWFHTYPRLAADVLVVNGDKVLLIERKFPPYGYAIPGGMVDYGETMESAATRELMEETGIVVSNDDITLVGIYSDPARDFRGHTVSAVYFAHSDKTPVAADDASSAAYFRLSDLPKLAFDHSKVIQDYVDKFHNK